LGANAKETYSNLFPFGVLDHLPAIGLEYAKLIRYLKHISQLGLAQIVTLIQVTSPIDLFISEL
jgi:hypothetical protein